MEIEEFNSFTTALRASAKRFPNCTIANCGCNSKEGEWRSGCICLCHFVTMSRMFGDADWTLSQFMEQAAKEDPTTK